MKRLYEARLLDGLDIADAVREANIGILCDLGDSGRSTYPFLWGAFVAVGDWR